MLFLISSNRFCLTGWRRSCSENVPCDTKQSERRNKEMEDKKKREIERDQKQNEANKKQPEIWFDAVVQCFGKNHFLLWRYQGQTAVSKTMAQIRSKHHIFSIHCSYHIGNTQQVSISTYILINGCCSWNVNVSFNPAEPFAMSVAQSLVTFVCEGVDGRFLYTSACDYLCVGWKSEMERGGPTCPCRWELAHNSKTQNNSTVHWLCLLSSDVINLSGLQCTGAINAVLGSSTWQKSDKL